MAVQRRAGNSSKNGQAPEGTITPEEAAKIRASVGGKELAPSTEQQALFQNWREASDQLGSPFEVERIPLSKLRAMRRDPMLGFGLSFIKTPHVRAEWFINAKGNDGPNAQISAHLDHDIRRIYASFVLQWTNSLDFGFQAIAKRFEFRVPSGTYIEQSPETGEQTEQPIWNEGGVEPIGWKPFIALPPELVSPRWKKGEFDGIDLNQEGDRPLPGGVGNPAPFQSKIDLYHSLWVTNERDANFGNLFGYPRLGYAYRYWWSYWFRWAIADRAFERKADPSVKVLHPDGTFEDDTGAEISYAEYALLMGDRMRSGGVIALPSEVYEDATGKGNVRQWDIEFTKDATNFEPFDKSFDYLDIQKLRSLWIPEQAFLEGKGGTSSRNVAAELGESFVESQAVLSSQIVQHINRWLIPQWLAVNYPEFVEQGGTAEFVMQGFSDQDIDFTKQIIQLVGQQELGSQEILKLVDLRKILEESGTPIASFAEQQRREQELAAQIAQSAPPAIAPTADSVGVVPGVDAIPTATNGASANGGTGFSYIGPRESVFLSDSGTDFIENLPSSPHYEDKAVKGFARQLWNLYRALYRDEINTAAEAIELPDGVEANEEEEGEKVELFIGDFTAKAQRLISKWAGSSRWPNVLDRTQKIFNSIAAIASRRELKRANLSATLNRDELEDWINDHLAEFAAKVAETSRLEIRDFIARRMEEGVTDRDELAKQVREHFDEFPEWKADRLVRTEVRDVYNQAVLMAARAAGANQVQALDAQLSNETDEDCLDRDGKIFNLDDAFDQDEHPNGTLGWRILPVELSVEKATEEMTTLANYDSEEHTVYLSDNLSERDRSAYMIALVDRLSNA